MNEERLAEVIWNAHAEIIHKQGFTDEMKSSWPLKALDWRERYLHMARRVIEAINRDYRC